MTQGLRTIAWVGALLASMFITACGGRRPPDVTPPDPPCDPRSVDIFVLNDDPSPRPMPGVVVSTPGQDDRISGPEGHVHFDACGSARYTFSAPNWQTANCGELGASCDFGGPEHRVHMTRIVPDPEPPQPEPGQHPDPVHGRLRTIGNECFADDTGCRNFAVVHMGDLAARWYAGCRDECLKDLDDAAAAGYHIVRTWWSLGEPRSNNPWRNGGSPQYAALNAFGIPDYIPIGAELIRAIAARGMRVAVGPGGIDNMNTAKEEALFRLLRQLVDAGGHENVAWLEAVNEPSSTHATSDNDGDNQPGHLTRLVRIAADGTGILWHLGYSTANDYAEAGRYCVSGTSYNYVHGWRQGNVGNKIDRRSTWARVFADNTGKPWCRLTIDGESVGWPVNGPPLRYVSNTANGHEMNSHEALGLIALGTALRGIPSHMSGTGVQRYEPFTNTVGWQQIPWMIRQLPREIAKWPIFHGGQTDSRIVMKATTSAGGVLGRVEQAVGPDGTFVAVAYNYQSANQHQDFEFARTATIQVCDVGAMSCTDPFVVHRGQKLPLDMTWGRLIKGRAAQ